jgi:hypothetical protein
MLIVAVMSPYFFKLSKGSVPNFSYMRWWPLLSVGISSLLAIGKDIGFFLWSRKRLYFSFREQSARSIGQPRFAAPPVLPSVEPSPVLAHHS